ncbi:MAG TPA: hypothetical protein VEA69_16120 [Tepidisphaeraceae bacterium]|nr:hypothetical protein [Tepidisphaeraceae bacterium]
MQRFAKFMAVLALVGFCGVAIAADKPAGDKPAAKKAAGLAGEVVSVDGTNVKIKKNDGTEVTVATDATTAVMIDGKEAKVADLKAGQKVRVAPESGTATKIQVGGGGKKPKADK